MTIKQIDLKTQKEKNRSWTHKEKQAHGQGVAFDKARVTFSDKRAKEYPPIGDQLDAIMKWIATENEITVPAELKSIAMKCMSVKAKYPKPDKEDKA